MDTAIGCGNVWSGAEVEAISRRKSSKEELMGVDGSRRSFEWENGLIEDDTTRCDYLAAGDV